MRFLKLAFVSAAISSLAVAAPAQTAPTLAKDGLQPLIEHLSQNPDENAFQLGMLHSLRALEKTLQTRYRYGIGDGLRSMPVLRIQTGQRNPTPEPATPETLSAMVLTFLTDMDTARAALYQPDPQAFTLTLQDLWFDVDANGTRSGKEGVADALGPLIMGWRYSEFARSDAMQSPITIRFDTADHAWLTAYTHMLSGVGDLYMAFDPARVIGDLKTKRAALADAPEIPNFYDQEKLTAEIENLREELK